MRRALRVLALLAVVPGARAAPYLVASASGPDLVLTDRTGNEPCVGQLTRSSVGPDPSPQPWGTFAACPITLAGEAAPDGRDFAGWWYELPGSSAAFRIERHFDVLTDPAGNLLENVYYVSLPLSSGIEDVASTAAPEANKCVGDPDGPAMGDGRITADDLICTWWTSRSTGQGSMMVSRRDEASASWVERVGMFNASGAFEFAGPWTGGVSSVEGLMVSVDGAPGTSNVAMIYGGHDPAWAGRLIRATTDRQAVLSLPAHGMYRTADEILCGLIGVDWTPGASGAPETCPNGLFDGQKATGAYIFDNDLSDGDGNRYVGRVVTQSLGRLLFAGTNFTLRPGDGVLLYMEEGHATRTWLEPHF